MLRGCAGAVDGEVTPRAMKTEQKRRATNREGWSNIWRSGYDLKGANLGVDTGVRQLKFGVWRGTGASDCRWQEMSFRVFITRRFEH